VRQGTCDMAMPLSSHDFEHESSKWERNWGCRPVCGIGALEMPSFPGVCTTSDAIYDLWQDQYPMVIREIIRHENDVTNHRIIWLLVGQGFIANAYVSARNASSATPFLLSFASLLLSLSAFVMLYQSYQARGYLQFLGLRTKQGMLQERYLPLVSWLRTRIKNWRRSVWMFRWINRPRDLMEPRLLVPYLFMFVWMTNLLHTQTSLNTAATLPLGAFMSSAILAATCMALVKGRRSS